MVALRFPLHHHRPSCRCRYSNPALVDPEEAFVAAVSSCHMLTYLYLASQQGFQVESYWDEALGAMTKNDKGVPWVSSIVLARRLFTVETSVPPQRTRSIYIAWHTNSASSPTRSRQKWKCVELNMRHPMPQIHRHEH